MPLKPSQFMHMGDKALQTKGKLLTILCKAVWPWKFRALMLHPRSAIAEIISLDVAQCSGVPPCFMSFQKKNMLKA